VTKRDAFGARTAKYRRLDQHTPRWSSPQYYANMTEALAHAESRWGLRMSEALARAESRWGLRARMPEALTRALRQRGLCMETPEALAHAESRWGLRITCTEALAHAESRWGLRMIAIYCFPIRWEVVYTKCESESFSALRRQLFGDA
jgi:hypothetical protein